MRSVTYLGYPLIVAAAASSAACPDREVSRLPEGRNKVEHKEIPITPSDKLDLLFVIDNSGSMAGERMQLTDNFPRFIDVLSNIPTDDGPQAPSLHIGVVTSDMGTSGAAGNISGCSSRGHDGKLQPPRGDGQVILTADAFIKDLRPATPGGPRIGNYDQNAWQLRTLFEKAASLQSANGCGFEAHLASLERALDPAVNPGFLRPDALLAVVIIADEDDCSVSPGGAGPFFAQDLQAAGSYACFKSSTVCDGNLPPQQLGPRQGCQPNNASTMNSAIAEMAAAVKRRKGEEQTIVAGIFGDRSPVTIIEETAQVNGQTVKRPGLRSVCDAPASAAPSPRLDAFVRLFPQHIVTSICNQDLSGPIREIAESFATFTGSPCLFGEPAEPYQCTVSQVTGGTGPQRAETIIPECDDAQAVKPCWHLERNDRACPSTVSHLAMKVERGGIVGPAGARLVFECVTQ